MNPAEQGLTLLSGRDAVLSLWYYDSTLDNFFSQKVTTKVNKSLISPGKIKNEKNRNENESDYTYFADRTRSSTFFIIDSDEDHQ